MTRRARHPFEGGKRTSGVTRRHVPLVWECMLGTVEARNPETGEEKYFDYDWDAAREFAQVEKASDLRIFAKPYGPVFITPGGQWVRRRERVRLWGVWEKKA